MGGVFQQPSALSTLKPPSPLQWTPLEYVFRNTMRTIFKKNKFFFYIFKLF